MYEDLKNFLRIISKSVDCCSLKTLKFLANIPNIDSCTDSSTILLSGTSSFSSMALNAFSILNDMSYLILALTSVGSCCFLSPEVAICCSRSISRFLGNDGILL